MSTRNVIALMILTLALSFTGLAGGKEGLQKYFSDAARKVKETTDPAEKRDILDKSFQTMSDALIAIESTPLATADERAGIEKYRAALREKQDELAGQNGFDRVPDRQLNAFSDYVVQDMEQADQYITVSLVTALLILILVILIA